MRSLALALLLLDKLADAVLRRLAEVFARYDKNGDGRLGPDEITALIEHIGGALAGWLIQQLELIVCAGSLAGDRKDAMALFKELDDNKDGAIQPVRVLSLRFVSRALSLICATAG